MNLIGKPVTHRQFGAGTVTAQDGNSVTVEFQSKTCRFIYPDAIVSNILPLVDASVRSEIIKEIQDAKAVKLAEEKHFEEAKRKESENHVTAQTAQRQPVNSQPERRTAELPRPKREPNKPMIFFVYQNKTFDQEKQGGYIWAPISNKTANCFHFWERLLDVRTGDIILHSYKSHIAAISTARGECYACHRPKELQSSDLWEKDGRRVDCDYIEVKNPIKTTDYLDDILLLSNHKYAAFDRYGSGNMGYLYELNRKLARIFISALVKQNPYLNSVDYIRKILLE